MAGDKNAAERDHGNSSWEGVFYFHPDDGVYKDHFPECPVVPGSLVVHAFLEAAAEAGFSSDYLTIENFRFREFLSPGHYAYRIELEENRLKCLIYRREKILVTGVLKR
jgi:3-hydroxyacyl-[acyl-carrier-protein] dehydratase